MKAAVMVAESVGDVVRGRRLLPKVRVYVLIEVAEGCSSLVAASLRAKPGVIMADVLEPRSEVMMVLEAQGRQRLAELTVMALASVEQNTVAVHLMPVDRTLNKCGADR